MISPSGGGKTSFIEHLRRCYPNVQTEELTERPFVHFNVPTPLTLKALATEFLRALGDPLCDQGQLTEKMRRIAELLVRCKVRVIAIDNFHDIPARRTAIGIRSVGDWVRDICEMKWAGILLALGTKEAEVVRDSNEQLKRRMMAKLEIRQFSVDDAEGIGTFKALLRVIDGALPLGEASNLDRPELLARIFYACNGNMDYLIKLISFALPQTVARGAERMEINDLKQGFDDLFEYAADSGNPFDANWKGCALNGPGQLFFNGDAEVTEQKNKKKGS